MPTLRWSKKLKEQFGWNQAKDVYVPYKECFGLRCFNAHDWNHNGRLVCLTNYRFGCPPEDKQVERKKS